MMSLEPEPSFCRSISPTQRSGLSNRWAVRSTTSSSASDDLAHRCLMQQNMSWFESALGKVHVDAKRRNTDNPANRSCLYCGIGLRRDPWTRPGRIAAVAIVSLRHRDLAQRFYNLRWEDLRPRREGIHRPRRERLQ